MKTVYRDLTINDVKFNINKEKKIIVCYIEDVKLDAINLLKKAFSTSKIIDWDAIEFGWITDKYQWLKLPDKLYCKAVCSDDDEWNEAIGKLVAFNKLKNKYEFLIFNKTTKFILHILDLNHVASDIIISSSKNQIKARHKREDFLKIVIERNCDKDTNTFLNELRTLMPDKEIL